MVDAVGIIRHRVHIQNGVRHTLRLHGHAVPGGLALHVQGHPVQLRAGFQMIMAILDEDHIDYLNNKRADAPYWTTLGK
mgnify:CR=1 FL=1